MFCTNSANIFCIPLLTNTCWLFKALGKFSQQILKSTRKIFKMDLSAIFTGGTTFVTSCLVSCATSPWVYSLGSKFFSLSVTLIGKGFKTWQLSPCKCFYFFWISEFFGPWNSELLLAKSEGTTSSLQQKLLHVYS